MASSESLAQQLLNFDIDRYLNPWIPHNRLYTLPTPINRFLGFRATPSQEIPPLLQWPVTFLATVAGLCLVAGITNSSRALLAWDPPVVIASLGASAVLDFNAIRAPLSQPRNSILGNTLSALVGVAITKLFLLSPRHFDDLAWVAGAVACACASVLMSLTNTVHPPGGATALLAATNAQVLRLSWRYVPLVLLGSVLLVLTALLFNNLLRQYPMFWWTPAKCGRQLRRERAQEKAGEEEGRKDGVEALERTTSSASSERTLGPDDQVDRHHFEYVDGTQCISIQGGKIELPLHLVLLPEEIALLEKLQLQLEQSSKLLMI